MRRSTILRHLVGAVVTIVALVTRSTRASEVAAPEPTTTHLVAVVGGVVAIPLKPPPANAGFPAEVDLEISDGAQHTTVKGRVVWLVERAPPLERHWTASANPLVVKNLPDGEDPRRRAQPRTSSDVVRVDGAMVLADLPDTTPAATLRLGKTTIEPHWIEPGPAPLMDPERGASWRDDRPDPLSPFEWFRWTLFADERQEPAPAPPGDADTQLMARHVAELWRAGLGRVARQSRGVSLTLRAWLTATCRVEDRPDAREVGAWVADPTELASLLSLLLDPARDDDATMRAALAWTDARTPLTLWIESDLAGAVTFAVANPLENESVVRVQWLAETLPPLATLVSAHTIGRMRVERPDRPFLGAPSDGRNVEPLVLAVVAGNFTKRVAVAPAIVEARPPAVSFGTFVAPTSLADAQSGRGTPVSAEWDTTASLRRRGERWEIFFECRAPSDGAPDDAVRLRVGRREVFVRRDGASDGDGDPLLDVGVKTFDDLWRARITLPTAWLPRPSEDGQVARFSLQREAGPLRSTAVLPVPAWAIGASDAPVVEVDLSRWSGS
ncbi:MAG: hypothetical protein U0572_04405 [Phycisphaerales bacterium]